MDRKMDERGLIFGKAGSESEPQNVTFLLQCRFMLAFDFQIHIMALSTRGAPESSRVGGDSADLNL